MKHVVLLVEDDLDIIALLRLYLRAEGYEVVAAENGRDALKLINNQHIDLAILDIMMPEMDGYELTEHIREISNMPIIILSAKDQQQDIILGLNLGADAYFTKPFNPLEIVANVSSQLRRFYQLGTIGLQTAGTRKLYVGELCLDLDNMTLTKCGNEIFLTSTEFKILAKMMKAPGRVFSKSQLYDGLGGEFIESDNKTMVVHISNLRDKIESEPKNPIYIVTVRGLGYKVEKPI